MNLLLLSLLATVFQAQPPDPRDGGPLLKQAVQNTQTLKSYETAFKSRVVAEAGTIDYQGRSVWVAPGILYLHYTASGNDDKKIVRVGEEVWVWSAEATSWVSSDQAALPGAARGIQNPDEILGVLAKPPGSAAIVKPGVVDLTLSGADLVGVMKNQAQNGTLLPGKSSAALELTMDKDQRLQKFTCDATLASAKEVVRYTTEVTFSALAEPAALKFTDEKGRPIPLHAEIQAKIDALLKPK